nr:MAG TPA: hypothetical protein [Caudoviricetes sp.]
MLESCLGSSNQFIVSCMISLGIPCYFKKFFKY